MSEIGDELRAVFGRGLPAFAQRAERALRAARVGQGRSGLAAFFEVALALAFLTGAFFSYASYLAAAYVIFLGFAFHGPSHWAGNQAEFGFFVDHFTFMAGLLFAAAYGPGDRLTWKIGAARAT